MKIRSVRSFLMSYPFAEPLRLPFYGGLRTIVKRDAMLIRVETSNGLVGYGPGPASESAQAAIQSVIAPFLEGRTLSEPDALRVQFRQAASADPSMMKVYGAVEVAQFDAIAKALGLPLSDLLGTRVRDRIRLYGSAGMYMAPEGYAEEAAAIGALGFTAYKMRPALGPEQDLETVRLMRQAAPSLELMVDAHAWWRMGDKSYSQKTVERLAKEMAEYEIAWLEEPLPPDDHAAYANLRALGHVPIASGEHEPDEERFAHLIYSGAADYVQMDVCCQGGFHMAGRILAEVRRENLKFAFHSWGTALEVLAAAQLGICWPESVVEYLEYPCYTNGGKAGMYPFPLADEILADPLELEHGELVVPEGPGLGAAVNEAVIERYPYIEGPWSFFRIDSPPQTLAVTSDHSVAWEGSLP